MKRVIFISIFAIASLFLLNNLVFAESFGGETCCESNPEPQGPGGYDGNVEYIPTYTTYYPPVYNYCTNGATNYPLCNNNQCTNGATNYPWCNYCPVGKIYSNGQCINYVTPTADINANPSVINQGNSSLLTWTSNNANFCTISGGGYIFYGITGSQTIYPNQTTTYTIYCTGINGGSATDSTTVTVNTVVNQCTNGATNYPYCNNNQCTNGATNYPLCNNNQCTNGATNYPLCNICPSGYTYINGQCVIYTVNPTATINVNPNSIYSGNSSILSWSSTNASTCSITGNGVSYTGLTGSQTIYPTTSGTYTIYCTGINGGSATAQTYITVNTVNNYCSNGATNYPLCNNNYNYCTNGATNYPQCNNNYNYCSNGATNYPYCNNNVTYVYCNGIQYVAPYVCPVNNNLTVSTTGASPNQNTATIYGYVNPNGVNTNIWFDYGTSMYNLQWQTNKQTTTNVGQFSAQLYNLQCGTRYYYRAAAQNYNATQYGQTLSFVTASCYGNNTSDTIITRSATSIGNYSAQLNGVWVSSGSNKSCQTYFDYGRTYSLGNRTESNQAYSSSFPTYFSRGITGLSPNTTYYYRAVVTCLDGTKYGNIYSFRTLGKKVYTYVPKPVTVVTTEIDKCNCETSKYMTLVVENLESEATIGKLANYKIVFKNTSTSNLEDVIVRVVLPEELTIYGADKGQFVKGGRTLTLNIPVLRPSEEAALILTANVNSNTKVGSQIVVNAYVNYTVPSKVKNGQALKDEVSTYLISVAGNGNSGNVNNGNNNSNTNTNSWMPTNAFDWILLVIVIVIFLAALRYLFTAFQRAGQKN